ncbi:hypothetical protein CFC21_112191, partial [Triticum aestivum]|nr:hypothetical protein [Triticum aestivum]
RRRGLRQQRNLRPSPPPPSPPLPSLPPPTEPPPPYPPSAKTSFSTSSSACPTSRTSSAPRSPAAHGSAPSAPPRPSAASSAPSTRRPSSGSSSKWTTTPPPPSPPCAARIPSSPPPSAAGTSSSPPSPWTMPGLSRTAATVTSSYGILSGPWLWVRAAVFSSETSDWAVHPWVEIGGDNSLKYGAGTLVDGSVYWPFYGEGRIIRINTATMDVSSLDLPSHTTIDYWQDDFMVGDTKDGELCIAHASDDFLLHVWIRSVGSDGIGIWARQNIVSCSAEIDRVTRGLEGQVRVVQVRSGCVYFSMTRMTLAGTQRTWFFYLSLETMEIELLIHGTFDDSAFPYHMAWPPCLIGDDGSTGHEVEASC